MTFINENGQEVPDINDPADGNVIVGGSKHTEDVPSLVDNDLPRTEPLVEEKPRKTRGKSTSKK